MRGKEVRLIAATRELVSFTYFKEEGCLHEYLDALFKNTSAHFGRSKMAKAPETGPWLRCRKFDRFQDSTRIFETACVHCTRSIPLERFAFLTLRAYLELTRPEKHHSGSCLTKQGH